MALYVFVMSMGSHLKNDFIILVIELNRIVNLRKNYFFGLPQKIFLDFPGVGFSFATVNANCTYVTAIL